MRTVKTTLRGVSPYSQSHPIAEAKEHDETHEQFEARIWKQRLHINNLGNVFIPPMAIKNALSEAAKYLSIQIPGKGKSTFTKHVEAGLLITEGIDLNIKPDDTFGERLFLPASGKRGDGKRVWRTYPRIDAWHGEVAIYVIDEIVLQEMPMLKITALEYILQQAGQLIGIGRFRPRNNGFYGRFAVEDFKVIGK